MPVNVAVRVIAAERLELPENAVHEHGEGVAEADPELLAALVQVRRHKPG